MTTIQTVAYNLSSVLFTQSTEEPHILIITAEDEYYNTKKIGSYNFFHKYGYLTLLNGTRKDFKQWKSLFNTFFKYDEMFGWSGKDINAAEEAGKLKIKAEKKAAIQEKKDQQTSKAAEYLNNVINKDEKTINNLQIFKESSDEKLLEVINNTFKNAISKQLVNDILSAIKEALNTTEEVPTEVVETVVATKEETANTTEETKQESFHLYKNTFPTYAEAYNYAINNLIPTTMIISSLHPTMTNERLRHLEHELVFSKIKMEYADMKEYFSYISELPTSLDQEERYFKLKSYIQRYESKQLSIQQHKEEQDRISIEGSRLLVFMKEKGLKLHVGDSYQRYYYKGEHVYSFFSGISTEKYYNDMKDLFSKHFAEYTDEYNNTTVHYYKGSSDTRIDNDNYPYGWISYSPNTNIAAFNRELSSQEMISYGLNEKVEKYK